MSSGDAILDDLAARGLLHDTTDPAALRARLAAGPITLYCGFDPTADSLHVGNLVGLLTLRRFQDHGHRPIVLAGGATGMIGDPGGRSEERNLLDDDALARNLEGIVPQLRQFLDFDGGANAARLVDNRSWTVALSAIEFLRDVGKHVTVNHMLAKDSVRSRLDGEAGISYTEFSYMLLQANDFLQLHELEGCELQVGGSDQWGNITLGIDLVRRRLARPVHGLTWPLLTKSDGTKVGKSSVGGQIWLGPHRMSPYQFFQAWMATDDADVQTMLVRLTLLPVSDVDAIVESHRRAPERREAQRVLARSLTSLVHGDDACRHAEEASGVLFGEGDLRAVGSAAWAMLAEEVPASHVDRDRLVRGVSLVDLAAETGLTRSKGEARQLLAQSGLRVNDAVADPEMVLDGTQLLAERYLLLRRGKRTHHLVVVV